MGTSVSTNRVDLTVAEALRLPTRLVELHPVTRADAARDFGGVDHVIPRALTMGIASILAARSIVILATGAHKAEAVARALTGPMTAELPASLLQSAADQVTWVIDEAAAKVCRESVGLASWHCFTPPPRAGRRPRGRGRDLCGWRWR